MLNQDEKRGRLMTKIVICGANGKMGHTVASCIAGRDDCTVVGGVDSYTEKYADFSIVATPAELPEVPEVIIDFSNPSTLDELLEYALVNNVALVLATTGYDDAQIQKIQSAAQQIPVFLICLWESICWLNLRRKQQRFWAVSLISKSLRNITIRRLMHPAVQQS